MVRTLLKSLPFATELVARLRLARGRGSQTDERQIIARLLSATSAPSLFVEFGFHPAEFNCIDLARAGPGLLIDGDAATVRAARRIYPEQVAIQHRFLTLDNLDLVADWVAGRSLGVLSIDVDGNDFWFAERLLPLRPAIAIAEYNASLGSEPVTVPYNATFRRHDHHPSGWYHGASLAALAALGARFGYDLVAVSDGGGNAFLVRRDLASPDWPARTAAELWRENRLRNRWAGNSAAEQWQAIAQLPFVQVGADGIPAEAAIRGR